jgi:hypothetical protein
MGTIFVASDNGVPQFACTACCSCNSIIGKSLCEKSNRGCCHYFPEYSIAEIHRLLHIEGGRDALEIILANPSTVINNFTLHAKGHFDRISYEKYISQGQLLETGKIEDHTIFFRTCPFVREGKGCIFPVRFRTTVCNFFVCSEIFERPDLQHEFRNYLEERTRYSRWIYRESTELQHILTENNLNLKNDIEGSFKLLLEIQPIDYEFPLLPPVDF